MALNIKNAETEQLVADIAAITHETKTRAITVALQERKDRLLFQAGRTHHAEEFRRFIAEEIWPQIPPNLLGKQISKEERENILGYGPSGV